MKIVSMLSLLHRVQGGAEIVEAARGVAAILEENGVEHRFEVFRGRLELEKRWGFWEPRGWRIEELELEVYDKGWRRHASLRDHPLVAVVHTPPGSVEGRVSREGISGIRLSEGFSRVGYWELEERGLKALIVYHLGPGIRYYSIFPPYFMREPRLIAVSLEAARARPLVGKKVRLHVDAKYGDLETPIIHAWVGERADPGILLLAHICHPQPGSHDNASGVAVTVEALIRLSRMYGSVLREAGVSIHLLIIPEYIGSATAMERIGIRPEDVLAAASIDMVGANLEKTGGVLLYHHSLFSLPSPLDRFLFHGLVKYSSRLSSFDSLYTYPSTPIYLRGYGSGSDHDITMALGIPSGLVNEWPDEYYHTSLDRPSNLDDIRLGEIVSGIVNGIVEFSKQIERVEEKMAEWVSFLRRHYAIYWAHVLEGEIVSRIIRNGIRRAVERARSVLGKTSAYPLRTGAVKRKGVLSPAFLVLVARRPQLVRGLGENARKVYLGIYPVALSALGDKKDAMDEARVYMGRRLSPKIVSEIDTILGYSE